MKKRGWINGLIVAWMGAVLAVNSASAQDAGSPLGRQIDAFTLPDIRGKSHSLAELSDNSIVVVAFLGTECPLAKLYGPRLASLAKELAPRGVAFLAVDANSQDSIAEIAAYGRAAGIDFPLLKDLGNRVADQFGAQRTPEVFVLDRERRIRYHGRIDDQYGVGYGRQKPEREELRLAITSLLDGRAIAEPSTKAVGCLIGRAKKTDESCDVTYSNQIARIFQKHCVECHRPGEIAPFSLTSYDECAGWADTIAEVIRQQRMPPWHAESGHVPFVNVRQMTDDEKDAVYRWAAAGAPRGDPRQLPAPVEYTTGWNLSRTPDMVVSMRDRPYAIPAEGTVEYQYFVVDPGFKEDKWIRAAEIIPGNRAVVHHVIVFIRMPEGVTQQGVGWLSAYVPGQSTFERPSHQARFVPAGAKFVFQMHYTTNGTPQEDLSKIGLIFAEPGEVREELLTMAAINHDFEIPPGAERFPVSAARGAFPRDAKLLAIAPHMHVRGKAFRVEAEDASKPGERQVVLNVPNYDFNWQHAYELSEPLPLRNLTLHATGSFDNSARNLVNPDPSATVRWGDQTWQEMMIGFFEISVPVDAQRYRRSQGETPLTAEQERAADQAADDFLRRFDKDGDGVVRAKETPPSVSTFAVPQFDTDGDKVITRDEARAAAVRSIRRKASQQRP